MFQTSPFSNSIQQETMYEAGNIAQRNAVFAFVLVALAFIFAIGVAIWMYRDAEARGKRGLAAGAISLLSFFTVRSAQ